MLSLRMTGTLEQLITLENELICIERTPAGRDSMLKNLELTSFCLGSPAFENALVRIFEWPSDCEWSVNPNLRLRPSAKPYDFARHSSGSLHTW